MKEQLQPDPKNPSAGRHGYGPILAITGGTCGLVGDPSTTTTVKISGSNGSVEKTYSCGTHGKAVALVNAIQNNAWVYDVEGPDTILLYAKGNTSSGQAWSLLRAIPTLDSADPKKMTVKYGSGGMGDSTATVTVGGTSPSTTAANLLAFAKTLNDGGWPLTDMTLGLGYIYTASTGDVENKKEAGWLSIGLILPTS